MLSVLLYRAFLNSHSVNCNKWKLAANDLEIALLRTTSADSILSCPCAIQDDPGGEDEEDEEGEEGGEGDSEFLREGEEGSGSWDRSAETGETGEEWPEGELGGKYSGVTDGGEGEEEEGGEGEGGEDEYSYESEEGQSYEEGEEVSGG